MKKAPIALLALILVLAAVALILLLTQQDPNRTGETTAPSQTAADSVPVPAGEGNRLLTVVCDYGSYRKCLRFAYDNASQAVAREEAEGVEASDITYRLTYDDRENLTCAQVITPQGTETTTYIYDGSQLVKTVCRQEDTDGKLLWELGTWYDAFGRISFTVHTQDQEKIQTDYAYALQDDTGFVSYCALVVGNQMVGQLRYTCDEQGNVVKVATYNDRDFLSREDNYENGRLMKRIEYDAAGEETEITQYTYDALGRLTGWQVTTLGQLRVTVILEYLKP